MKRWGALLFIVATAAAVASALIPSGNASADSIQRAVAERINFCRVEPNGFFDFVWMTALDGSHQVTVPQGATQVSLLANVYGHSCSGTHSGSAVYTTGDRSVTTLWSVNRGLFSGGYQHFPTPNQPDQLYRHNVSVNIGGLSGTQEFTSNVDRTYAYGTVNGRWGTFVSSPSATWRITINRESPWTTSSASRLQSARNTDRVGQDIGFEHRLYNNGPNATDAPISYATRIVRVEPGRNGVTTGTAPNISQVLSAYDAHTSSNLTRLKTRDNYTPIPTNRRAATELIGYATLRNNTETRHNIVAADVGKWICSYITSNPARNGQSAWVRSTPSCKFIRADYSLVPSVQTPSTVLDEPGATIRVDGVVTKSGNRATSYPTDTRYIQVVQKNGQPTPAINSSGVGCAYYGVPTSRCSVITPSRDGDNFTYRTTGSNGVAFLDATVPTDFEPGDRLCFGLSVSGFNETNGSAKSATRHSALVCITMGKKPKVHVIGGDLYVGRGTPSASRGNISTSVSQLSRQTATGETTDDVNQRADNAQREWLFGVRGKISFNSPSGSTTGFTTGVAANTNVSVAGEEGVTVATDGSGTVRFVTDGLRIYRANGTVMPYNGSTTYDMGANGSTTQAAATFPIGCADSAPCNRYAVVTSSAATENSRMGNLRYSIVDIDSNTVLRINRPFGPQGGDNRVGEALSVAPMAISGSAETGYWVVANLPGYQTMRAFRVPFTWDGEAAIAAPVDSFRSSGGANVSTGITSGKRDQTYAPGFGTINFSTDFTRSIIAMSKTGGTAPGSVRIMNFNKATGIFTQQYAWNVPANTGTHPAAAVYSGDFSQNGQYAYVSTLYAGNGSRQGQVFRYRLTGTNATVASSVTLLNNSVTGNNLINGCTGAFGAGGAVKRGPDGSIYVAGYSCPYVFRVSQAAANGATTPTLSRFNLGSGAVSSFGLPQTAAMLRSLPRPAEYYGESYGSWAEYGIAASRQVNGMASAAGYAGGLRQTGTTSGSVGSPSLCMLSFLTFSNRAASGSCAAASIGYYTPPTSRTAAEYYEGRSTATLPLKAGDRYGIEADLASGVYLPRNGSAIALSASTLSAGKSVVIYAPNNDVVIEGNQSYDGGRSLSSISQIPQLVIIARNIRINENVSNVDAWLIAKTAGAGNIYTCGTITAPTQSQCTNRLTVNGPVLSNKLHMLRTAGAGAGADAAAPAEVFNLRPDAYLWGVSQGSGNGRIPTASVKELPPRF